MEVYVYYNLSSKSPEMPCIKQIEKYEKQKGCHSLENRPTPKIGSRKARFLLSCGKK